jgi:hypothetical protein
LEFLAKAIGQVEEIKVILIGKKEVKLSLLANNMILYLNDHKNSTKNLRPHKHFLQGIRIPNQYTKINSFSIQQQ